MSLPQRLAKKATYKNKKLGFVACKASIAGYINVVARGGAHDGAPGDGPEQGEANMPRLILADGLAVSRRSLHWSRCQTC